MICFVKKPRTIQSKRVKRGPLHLHIKQKTRMSHKSPWEEADRQAEEAYFLNEGGFFDYYIQNKKSGQGKSSSELTMHQTFRIQKPGEKGFKPFKEPERPIKPSQPVHHRVSEKTCPNFFRTPGLKRAHSVNKTGPKIVSAIDLAIEKTSSDPKYLMNGNIDSTAAGTFISISPSGAQRVGGIDFETISAKIDSFRRPQTHMAGAGPVYNSEKTPLEENEVAVARGPSGHFKIRTERVRMTTTMNSRQKGFGLRMSEIEKDEMRMRENIIRGQAENNSREKVPQECAGPNGVRTSIKRNGESVGKMPGEKALEFAIFDKFIKRDKDGLRRPLEGSYVIGKIIGKGSYASVRMVLSKETGAKLAMKTYEKQKLYDETRRKNVRRETEILLRINHPNVIKLHEVFNSESHVHLVMEYFCTQSLHSYMKSKPRQFFDEQEAKPLFKQIVEALAFCHSKYVVHRDMKLDNVLVDSRGKIKLIDFGFSISADQDQRLTLFCGTPSYMPPEIILKKEYCGPPADTWSSGIMLYKMLSGRYPFVAKDDKSLYREICKCELRFPEHFSREVRHLLSQIIVFDPSERIKSSAIADHFWFAT